MADDADASNNPVVRLFRERQRALVIAARAVEYQHAVTNGSSREELVRTWLSEFLPSSTIIEHGFVVAGNTQSREADVIIAERKAAPIRWPATASVIPATAAIWVLEVKSNWTRREMHQISRQTAAVRGDWVYYPNQDSIGVRRSKARNLGGVQRMQRPEFGAICFRGGKRQTTVEKALREVVASPGEEPPSLICMLDGGMIVEVVGTLYGPERGRIVARFYETGEDTLLAFAFALLHELDDREWTEPFVSPILELGEDFLKRFRKNEIQLVPPTPPRSSQ